MSPASHRWCSTAKSTAVAVNANHVTRRGSRRKKSWSATQRMRNERQKSSSMSGTTAISESRRKAGGNPVGDAAIPVRGIELGCLAPHHPWGVERDPQPEDDHAGGHADRSAARAQGRFGPELVVIAPEAHEQQARHDPVQRMQPDRRDAEAGGGRGEKRRQRQNRDVSGKRRDPCPDGHPVGRQTRKRLRLASVRG